MIDTLSPLALNELLDRPSLEQFNQRNTEQQEKIDAFHAHLDVCAQCENQPFNLCPVGDRLIREAV